MALAPVSLILFTVYKMLMLANHHLLLWLVLGTPIGAKKT